MGDITIEFTFAAPGELTDRAVELLKDHINSFAYEHGRLFSVATVERVDEEHVEFRVESRGDFGYGAATLHVDRLFRSFRDQYQYEAPETADPIGPQHTIPELTMEFDSPRSDL